MMTNAHADGNWAKMEGPRKSVCCHISSVNSYLSIKRESGASPKPTGFGLINFIPESFHSGALTYGMR